MSRSAATLRQDRPGRPGKARGPQLAVSGAVVRLFLPLPPDMDLTHRVRRTIRRYGLASSDTRVLAAVSGGSDSVALAYLLADLDGAGDLSLAGFAHFNHQLRASADRDEQFCRDLAATIGRPFIAGREDVRARAARERRSIEDAARTARHTFLEDARAGCGADVIALGHTKDDQAETFLLRLLRGAGARGLAAMHPRNGRIVRPLLECRRTELEEELERRNATFVYDETNDDVGVPRNRIRHELLPLLAERFNPAVVDALADAAEIAREEWAWMSGVADAAWARAVVQNGDRWVLDVLALSNEALPVLRFVAYRAMCGASGGRPIGFEDVSRTVDLVRFGGAPFDAPGQRVERIASQVVLTGRPAGAVGRLPRRASARADRYPLAVPGAVELPDSGCVVSAEVPPSAGGGGGMTSSNPVLAVVRRDRCMHGLAVRFRRPGDRFHPPGLGGGKKLQDYFVDRKIERRQRDQVPLVVDDRDRIVWVAGHAVDEEFRVTDPAQAVLILRLKGLGGSD